MTYLARDITHSILAALQSMPVVVVTGMRQTGKSTFLQQQPELRGRRFITLDDLSWLSAARENPEGLVDTDELLIIDEAQRCPELFIAIKRAVDKKRTPGQFILSGSANFLLMKHIAESLAGRAAYFNLHPFTRRELHGQTAKVPFLKRFFTEPTPPINGGEGSAPIILDEVIQGGMPLVSLGEVRDKDIWFKGYEQTYLERDIRDLSRIGNIIPFRNFLRLAAFRTGQLLRPSELGRDARLTTATVSSYLSLLEVSCVMYRLAPYLRNRASRLVKASKFYLGDSGLACYLAGTDTLTDHPLKGAMMETYIAQNLVGILDATWPQATIAFWNIQGRHEVDFVIEVGHRCIAVETKASPLWDRKDLAGLKSFMAATPDCVAGILAHNGTTAVRIGERLWAIPLSLLLS